MESNLKFIETWEVAQFKAQQGVEKLEVKQNPHTGKVFFVYGFETRPLQSESRDRTADRPGGVSGVQCRDRRAIYDAPSAGRGRSTHIGRVLG